MVLQAIDRFSEDPDIVVMLASLKASGTGITVTCASEVVLMEPYWNPFVSALPVSSGVLCFHTLSPSRMCCTALSVPVMLHSAAWP